MLENKQRSTCYCGMNSHCFCGCGFGQGALPCNCDRTNSKSFYYDPKFKVMCSKCGLSIPYGERYDYTYPVCEGCYVGVEDDLDEDENMSLRELKSVKLKLGNGSVTEYHMIERVNGKVTSFTCGEETVTNPSLMAVLNYCPYCGKLLSSLKPITWNNGLFEYVVFPMLSLIGW